MRAALREQGRHHARVPLSVHRWPLADTDRGGGGPDRLWSLNVAQVRRPSPQRPLVVLDLALRPLPWLLTLRGFWPWLRAEASGVSKPVLEKDNGPLASHPAAWWGRQVSLLRAFSAVLSVATLSFLKVPGTGFGRVLSPFYPSECFSQEGHRPHCFGAGMLGGGGGAKALLCLPCPLPLQ